MNKVERNIWKLNNLPPLEYCSIARAQKLLQCELEDLLHWHDIGAISLCLKLKKNRGTLNSALTRNQGLATHHTATAVLMILPKPTSPGLSTLK
ncbi:hypothetical protein ACU62B_17855 [Klebsiella aerogenes]